MIVDSLTIRVRGMSRRGARVEATAFLWGLVEQEEKSVGKTRPRVMMWEDSDLD